MKLRARCAVYDANAGPRRVGADTLSRLHPSLMLGWVCDAHRVCGLLWLCGLLRPTAHLDQLYNVQT